jgi:hypothetical protein
MNDQDNTCPTRIVAVGDRSRPPPARRVSSACSTAPFSTAPSQRSPGDSRAWHFDGNVRVEDLGQLGEQAFLKGEDSHVLDQSLVCNVVVRFHRIDGLGGQMRVHASVFSQGLQILLEPFRIDGHLSHIIRSTKAESKLLGEMLINTFAPRHTPGFFDSPRKVFVKRVDVATLVRFENLLDFLVQCLLQLLNLWVEEERQKSLFSAFIRDVVQDEAHCLSGIVDHPVFDSGYNTSPRLGLLEEKVANDLRIEGAWEFAAPCSFHEM